jgi:ribosome-binding protein aMBF1 (putative translation factor)
MDLERRKRVKKAGFRLLTVQEFLGLTDEESALIEMRLSLAQSLREHREKLGISHADLARRVGSTAARVAKMEAADHRVSIDLFVRSLLKLGATRSDLGRAIARKSTVSAA